jgi:hypothetical protein
MLQPAEDYGSGAVKSLPGLREIGRTLLAGQEVRTLQGQPTVALSKVYKRGSGCLIPIIALPSFLVAQM